MSKQLYEEALAEVRQLKQLAEDNAKKAIIDEVTPRIRALIESQLVGETTVEETDESANTEESVSEETEETAAEGKDDSSLSEDLSENKKKVLELRHLVFKLGRKVNSLKLVEPSLFASRKEGLAEALKTTYVLTQESVTDETVKNLLQERLDTYYRTLLQQEPQMISRKNRLNEADLNVKIKGFSDEAISSDELDKLSVEIVPDTDEAEDDEEAGGEEEESNDEDLLGGEESGEEKSGEEGSDEKDLFGSDEEPEEKETKLEGRRMNGIAMLKNDTVVEIDEGMLRREIARMKALREGKVEGKSVAGKKMTPGVLSAFGGGHDEGDAWLDGKVTTEGLDEDMMDESDDLEEADEVDEVYEVHGMEEGDELDELVKELTSGHEDEAHKVDHEPETHKVDDEDEDEAHSMDPHGVHSAEGLDEYGMDEDEEVDEDEEKEVAESGTEKSEGAGRRRGDAIGQNVADQHPSMTESRRKLGRVLETRKASAHKAQKARRIMEAARKVGNKAAFLKAKKVYTEAATTYARATKAARVLSESLKRSSNSRVVAETATLRKQLAETNLFNAKLLYTNKLLQNESMTPRQKVSIIEKLDEARSLREAKLVYESLMRTISSGKDRVNEGADRQVLGSASRATRPASTVSLNEGIEASRWAKLAGIVK